MVGAPLTEKEIRELFVKEKTCWLATIAPKGKPHLIPIHFGFFDGKAHIIFANKKSKSVRNIEHNPNVCFGINIGYRANEIKCVLIHGKAQLIDDITILENAHQKILTKYLPSKEKTEEFLQRLIVSGAIAKRTLVVLSPEKIISWKL